MSPDAAERAVMTSALVVAVVYGYRHLEEGSQPGLSVGRLLGAGEPVPFASWATAWGTVFLMLAIVSEFAPGPAGAFAILTAGSSVLVNGKQLFADLGKQTNPPGTPNPAATPKTTS